MPAIHRAQAGLIADMDYVADVLFNRVAKHASFSVRQSGSCHVSDFRPCFTGAGSASFRTYQECHHGRYSSSSNRDRGSRCSSARRSKCCGFLAKH